MDKVATIVLRVHFDESAEPEDGEAALTLIRERGFNLASDSGWVFGNKIVVREAGVSFDGVTAAVLDSKSREVW